ncbi:MAG: ATP-binding protein [Gammaproteobacteria bacterium]|uniref:ATP-binding protein n=1 Tax=Rhodoferax sp. TaxID=50421 RepID=UPI001D631A91|nr:ATP-binding protein [Rhodoferax sp.]MBU3900375.1 ATP-binding protein [Gammaproteobacteria bacterium]MBU3999314.1 ATP-binding protein [Gammaproteobacteria bacterium]MBU4018961.1 ATP-binding protein [Gammaproteobacteria bacterium]MBU4080952.1 ATP-binding protein [Gammaproteobacteria bacterium]MBU4113682.1 ATP-binding protein [Gammaproteobacteria bacterium]
MKRYVDDQLRADMGKKMVLLTGPRQVGKTTVSRMLQAEWPSAVYLNYDSAPDRATILSQSWSQRAPLLVLDEIHKMPHWKSWLKGVFDGRALVGGVPQQILVTGSARMDTFRQAGESLAGRYFALRLHPISLREWCQQTHTSPDDALTHLLARGGFPEPCLADSAIDADRWRRDYFTDLIREDVLEFSRLKDINAMRLFAQTLQKRVGSPLSLASIARDMGVSSKTLTSYLEILQALFIVFTVRPWSRNITRATLLQPKVYFFDTGLVQGDAGVRFENLVACHLLKHAHWQQDAMGKSVELHYLRTKDGAEVDFALSDLAQGEPQLTDLIECKLADTKPHPALKRFAAELPQAQAVQLLRDIRHEQDLGAIQMRGAANWLMALSA